MYIFKVCCPKSIIVDTERRFMCEIDERRSARNS